MDEEFQPEPNEVGPGVAEIDAQIRQAEEGGKNINDPLSEVLGTLLGAAIGGALEGKQGALIGAGGAANQLLDVNKEERKQFNALLSSLRKQRAKLVETARKEKREDILKLEDRNFKVSERLAGQEFKAQQNKLYRTSKAASEKAAAHLLANVVRQNQRGSDFATKAILESETQAANAILRARNIQKIIEDGKASGDFSQNENVVKAITRNLGVKINPNTKAGDLYRAVTAQSLESLKDLIKGNATENERKLLEEVTGRSTNLTIDEIWQIQEVIQTRKALEVLQKQDLFLRKDLTFPGVADVMQRREELGTSLDLFEQYKDTGDPSKIYQAFAMTSFEPKVVQSAPKTQGGQAGRKDRLLQMLNRLEQRSD